METRSIRALIQMAAGYQHEVIREYQEPEPSQQLDSKPLSGCDDEYDEDMIPVQGFTYPPPMKKTPMV